MPAISSITVSTASSDLTFEGGGHRRKLTVKRHPRARSFRLRVDPRDGRILLSLPKRSSLRKAERWAESQRDWIEGKLADLPEPRPIGPGATLPYLGRDIVVHWHPDQPRAPVLEGDRLLVGGPHEAVSARVTRWLKDRARSVLAEESARYARQASVQIGRISIGDARSRWGSCAASGNIRYSWRLIMAPIEVIQGIVAHEVAHRLHMNHGPDFHAAVGDLLGRDPKPGESWLRKNGAALYWIGRSS